MMVSNPSTSPMISSIAVSRGVVTNLTTGSTQQFSQATWASSDQSVATISPTGVVTGIAPGQTDITAFYEGVTSTAINITVISK
jgi:uncharacterized protein YjdB